MSAKEQEPIRIFKSDFLEKFTHIWPWQILVLWTPVMGFFLGWSIFLAGRGEGTVLGVILSFLLGVFIWTFSEYVLHRWLFHFTPKNAWQERVSFLFHGVHHEQPMCKSRLVMPPPVSIPLSLIFIFLFWVVFDVFIGAPVWMRGSFAGFILGYLWYDVGHYAFHHFNIKSGYLKYVRTQHMRHHGSTPDKRFGVSNPFWDFVFGTMPKEEKKKAS